MKYIAKTGLNHIREEGPELRIEPGQVVPDEVMAISGEWLIRDGLVEPEAKEVKETKPTK